MGGLQNIKLSDFRRFLESKGLKCIRTNGGHEVWGGHGILRPIVLQTHINPVPAFIVKNNLRTLNSSSAELLLFLDKSKTATT